MQPSLPHSPPDRMPTTTRSASKKPVDEHALLGIKIKLTAGQVRSAFEHSATRGKKVAVKKAVSGEFRLLIVFRLYPFKIQIHGLQFPFKSQPNTHYHLLSPLILMT